MSESRAHTGVPGRQVRHWSQDAVSCSPKVRGSDQGGAGQGLKRCPCICDYWEDQLFLPQSDPAIAMKGPINGDWGWQPGNLASGENGQGSLSRNEATIFLLENWISGRHMHGAVYRWEWSGSNSENWVAIPAFKALINSKGSYKVQHHIQNQDKCVKYQSKVAQNRNLL